MHISTTTRSVLPSQWWSLESFHSKRWSTRNRAASILWPLMKSVPKRCNWNVQIFYTYQDFLLRDHSFLNFKYWCMWNCFLYQLLAGSLKFYSSALLNSPNTLTFFTLFFFASWLCGCSSSKSWNQFISLRSVLSTLKCRFELISKALPNQNKKISLLTCHFILPFAYITILMYYFMMDVSKHCYYTWITT